MASKLVTSNTKKPRKMPLRLMKRRIGNFRRFRTIKVRKVS